MSHRDQENSVRQVSGIVLLVNHRFARDPAEHCRTAYSDPPGCLETVDCSVCFPVVHSSANLLVLHHSAAEQATAIRRRQVLATHRPLRTAQASASSAAGPRDSPWLCGVDRAAQNLNPAARILVAICWRDSSGLPETAAVVEAEREISQESLRSFSAAMKGHQRVTAIRVLCLIPSVLARNSSAEILQATANVSAVPCAEADRPRHVPATGGAVAKDRPERSRNRGPDTAASRPSPFGSVSQESACTLSSRMGGRA